MARKQKNETPKFAVTVLWLHGMSIAKIAQMMDLTGGQVRGMVDRSGFSNRSDMDDRKRQDELNKMALDRKDDGLVPDKYFRVLSLRPEQVRQSKEPARGVIPGGFRNTKRHPDGAFYLPSLHKPVHIFPYIRENDFEKQRQDFYWACAWIFEFDGWNVTNHQIKEVMARDKAGNVIAGRDGRQSKKTRYGDRAKIMEREVNSAPFEFMQARNMLDQVQIAAGQRVRADFEGAQISALKSADLAAVGGGGFGARPVSDFVIDCQKSIAGLRKSMPAISFRTLEDVVFLDRWLWDGAKGKHRKEIYDRIRVALDYAALHLELIPLAEFKRKWPKHPTDRRAADGQMELQRSIVRAKGGNNGR